MISFHVTQMVVQQSWQVALLALAVWGITRFLGRDRAYLCHMLWAIVLIKCVTPPIWGSPIGIFSQIIQQAGMSQQEPSEVASHAEMESRTGSKQVVTTVIATNDGGPSNPKGDYWQLKTTGKSACLVLASLWIAIAVGFTLFSIGRYVLFWRWVKRTTCDTPIAVIHCVNHLSATMNLRMSIDVRVVDSLIGPVVCGLWNPTIVLPKAIVVSFTEKEMEPLIAHELVHIRRGDLWLALLQSLASSMGWFHPMVWFASRQMTIESERCCDEATIALLKCKPAAYARSLLAVLEWKHLLRVAPALPGVRPVDVTSARLERIMRLGQGSRSRAPWWIWCIALFVGGAALPGAPFAGAQPPERKGSDPEVSKQPVGASIATQETAQIQQPLLAVPAKESAVADPDVIRMEVRIVDVKPDTEEFKKIEQILNAHCTLQVPILSNIPYLNRLFHSSLQLARDAAVRKALQLRVDRENLLQGNSVFVLPNEEYQKIVAEGFRGPGAVVVSTPHLTIQSGQKGEATVGQFDEGNPEVLANGFSLSLQPTMVGKDKILVLYEMSRSRREDRTDRDTPIDSTHPSPIHVNEFKTGVILEHDQALVVVSPSRDAIGSLEFAFIKCSTGLGKN